MADPLTTVELFREARYFAIAHAIEFSNTHKIHVETCVGKPKCYRVHDKGFVPCEWCFRIDRCEDRTIDEVDEALQAYTRGH